MKKFMWIFFAAILLASTAFCGAADDSTAFFRVVIFRDSAWVEYVLTFEQWEAFTGEDLHSKEVFVAPGTDSLFVNATFTDQVMNLGQYAYHDVDSNRFTGSFVLPPCSSKLLFRDGLAGFLVLQDWYFQGAPGAAYFEGFGIHNTGIIYQTTLGSPATESNTRTAADSAVNKYWSNIVGLDYEYFLFVDPRADGAAIAHVDTLCKIARWFKTQQPSLKTSFDGGLLPIGEPSGKESDYWAGSRSAYVDSLASWRAADDQIKFLVDSVDYLLPSIYPWYADTTEFCGYARAIIAEAKRIAKGKPVYPVISPQAFSTGDLTLGVPVSYDYFARMLKVVKDAGADGVIIWGSTLMAPNNYQWDDNAGWWTALKEFTASLGISSVKPPINKSLQYTLFQNYPNPFSSTTNIAYVLKEQTNVKLTVYDILGRRISVIVNERQKAGRYIIRFSGLNLASGAYFYRLETPNFEKVLKMILLK